MVTALSLSVLEQNDSKALVFTDNTGYGTGGWGDSGNIEPSDIDNSTHTLSLDITRKTLENTVIYDTIPLIGPWATSATMIFTITPMDLLISGIVEDGVTVDSEIIDAIYTCVYTLDEGLPTQVIYTVYVLAYNQIKVKVYEKLRTVPQIYNAYDSRSKEISDTLLQYTILKSIEAMAYVALEDELLETLDTIQKLNTNGSNYTWQ